MSKKKTKDPNMHDECVRAVAEELRKDKWDVKANVEGFEKPVLRGSQRPDLEAHKKGCMSRICEIATEEMFEGDKERYFEIKNYCDEYDFHFFVVDKDGKRREIDPSNFGKKKTTP